MAPNLHGLLVSQNVWNTHWSGDKGGGDAGYRAQWSGYVWVEQLHRTHPPERELKNKGYRIKKKEKRSS